MKRPRGAHYCQQPACFYGAEWLLRGRKYLCTLCARLCQKDELVPIKKSSDLREPVMNWIHMPRGRKFVPDLNYGTVCWVYSAHTDRCQAAVYTEDGWRCHGQEHFSVPGVTKYIILPTK